MAARVDAGAVSMTEASDTAVPARSGSEPASESSDQPAGNVAAAPHVTVAPASAASDASLAVLHSRLAQTTAAQSGAVSGPPVSLPPAAPNAAPHGIQQSAAQPGGYLQPVAAFHVQHWPCRKSEGPSRCQRTAPLIWCCTLGNQLVCDADAPIDTPKPQPLQPGVVPIMLPAAPAYAVRAVAGANAEPPGGVMAGMATPSIDIAAGITACQTHEHHTPHTRALCLRLCARRGGGRAADAPPGGVRRPARSP